jgi:hypothetical protein
MKKIEDYIDKAVGINCSNKKEFDDIIKLINVIIPNSRSSVDYSKETRYVLNLNNINHNGSSTIGVGSLADYKTYIIYPASDFLIEFEVGKWYKMKYPSISKSEFIIKYPKDNSFKVCNNIENGKFFTSGSFMLDRILGEEVSIEEIQQYLPDGHVDKIKVDIVPEYVECIKLPEGWTTYTKIGKIYKTDSYSNSKYRIIYEDGGGQSTIGDEHCFKPSTKAAFDLQQKELLLEEARKRYKLGDKVMSNYNQVFVITNIDNFTVDKFGSVYHNNGKNIIFDNNKWAEIVEQPKKVKQDEFVFPEFWYIEVNEKSLDAINKHRLTDFKIPIKLNEWAYYGISSYSWDRIQAYNTIPKDAVKITLEEFKKYVLKETLAEKLIPLQQAVESVRCNIEHNFQLAGFNGGIFQLEHEVKSIIKPINKIELNLKKTTIKLVVKQRKQLTIIKTKKLKLN